MSGHTKDWAGYELCPVCLVDAGRPCRYPYTGRVLVAPHSLRPGPGRGGHNKHLPARILPGQLWQSSDARRRARTVLIVEVGEDYVTVAGPDGKRSQISRARFDQGRYLKVRHKYYVDSPLRRMLQL